MVIGVGETAIINNKKKKNSKEKAIYVANYPSVSKARIFPNFFDLAETFFYRNPVKNIRFSFIIV